MITAQDITLEFKELLDLIKDTDLKERVVTSWLKGCELGNWKSLAELKKMPFTLLTDAKELNLIEHTIAVTKGAIGLAQAQLDCYHKMPYDINMDYLIAGGILHDVGKLMEIEPDGTGSYQKSFQGKITRHPISGAILCAEQGLPAEIINMIACHAKEGEGRPQTLETILIHQADFATFNPLVMLKANNLILTNNTPLS